MPAKKRLKLLLLEDEEIWINLILKYSCLDKYKDTYPEEIKIARSSDEANELINKYTFKVAITDLRLRQNLTKFSEWNAFALKLTKSSCKIIVISHYLELKQLCKMVSDYNISMVFDKDDIDWDRFNQFIEQEAFNFSTQKKTSSNQLSWLHISDFHFEKQHNSTNFEIILATFLTDVEKLVKSILQPDLVFITGDLAFAGKLEEYNSVSLFIKELQHRIGTPFENIYIVPGNHDVEREKIDSELIKLCQFKNKSEIDEFIRKDYFLHVQKKFKNFYSFLDSLDNSYKPAIDEYNSSVSYNIIRKIRDISIHLTLFNSAWSSGHSFDNGTVYDKGRLYLGSTQLPKLNSNFEKADLKIALIHHPLNYLSDLESSDMNNFFLKNFDILLHGHLHRNNFQNIHQAAGNSITIPTGALFQGDNLISSYNIGIFDNDSKDLLIKYRRYSDIQQCWIKDLDITGEENDGEIHFQIPEK